MPSGKTSATITFLLQAWGEGDPKALHALVEQTYATLHGIARAQMWHERADHTLTPTALINEAYIKMVDSKVLRLQNRIQFFALCGVIVRNILTSYARRRQQQKRGSGKKPLSLEEAALVDCSADELIALDDALNDLAAFDARKALIVEIRFFGGLSTEQAAEAMAVSTATIKRELRVAKAWLANYLAERSA